MASHSLWTRRFSTRVLNNNAHKNDNEHENNNYHPVETKKGKETNILQSILKPLLGIVASAVAAVPHLHWKQQYFPLLQNCSDKKQTELMYLYSWH